MTLYSIRWELDIEADTPVEAALKAHALMAGPPTEDHMMEVWGELGYGTVIDLRDAGVDNGPLIPPHIHNFVGDEDTCNVYRACPLTWGQWLAHQRKESKE